MWQDLPRHSECQSSVCNLRPAHSWTFKGTLESAVCLCVCGCKGAQQWLEHVLTFILRNCARSPPERPPVCLFFFMSADRECLQRVARKLNGALKSFESVFSKFCPRFEAPPPGYPRISKSSLKSVRKLTGKISCCYGGVGLHLSYAHSVCCRKTNKIFLALLPKNTQSIGHKHLPRGVF